MQIILMEKVANLGALGDVVTVKNGYARNFLIPQKVARRATAANLEVFAQKKAELEALAAEKLAAAQARAVSLEGFALTLTQKAGPDGRLFGSVTNADLADALKAVGHEVSKAQVRMPNGPIKAIGDNTLTLALHTDVLVDITVTIKPE
ncbi:MAG: 50S ribosomal protein L9 [Betaproteobacteria bacterium]|nr:MAG: 50S ribosomal protein L9 [Betaproteobacteria bacterium]